MKALILIGDGMSDYPLKALGGKTPLEAARTPNMDFLARNGICGWTKNVPSGMEPGSDVAAMSIFGYNPKKYYTGRGPLEAASLGVKLKRDEIAFRCNLITVKGGKMDDFTAGHIATKEAKKIIEKLNHAFSTKEIKFYTGLSYRHLLVMKAKYFGKIKTTPPHDITGKPMHGFLPQGRGAEILIRLMNKSEVLLHGNKTKATMIWPWGEGPVPRMPSFKQRFGKKAAVITAVHLLKGLGKIVGMEVINVPGATGYLDTNYKGKAEYALRALKRNDLVFIHVEAPDEAGHEGNIKHKIKAIEDFDRLVVGTILKSLERRTQNTEPACRQARPGLRILVLPDHPTPIKLMTHTSDPVPFVIYDSHVRHCASRITGFNEKELKKAKLQINQGHELLGKFLGGKI